MSKSRLTSNHVEVVRLAANRVCNGDYADRWDSVTSAFAFLDLTDPTLLTVHTGSSVNVELLRMGDCVRPAWLEKLLVRLVTADSCSVG